MSEKWTLETYGPGDNCLRVKDENGLLVADMGTRLDDARLIAAAPEMRDRLAWLTEMVTKDAPNDYLLRVLHQMVADANALLAHSDGPRLCSVCAAGCDHEGPCTRRDKDGFTYPCECKGR